LYAKGISQAKMALKQLFQNEFLRAFVGNCKPHTIFTATKNLLSAGKQFFHPRQIFFVGRTHHFSRRLHLCKLTGSKQDKAVRHAVEKCVVLREEFQSN
jgi:hypothetical protein